MSSWTCVVIDQKYKQTQVSVESQHRRLKPFVKKFNETAEALKPGEYYTFNGVTLQDFYTLDRAVNKLKVPLWDKLQSVLRICRLYGMFTDRT